jgi:hypothetical protein
MDVKHVLDTLAHEEQPSTTVDLNRAIAAGRATRRRRWAVATAGALSVCLATVITWSGMEQRGRDDDVAAVVVTDALPASGVGPVSYAYYDWCGQELKPGKMRALGGKECLQWKVVTRTGQTYRVPEAVSVYVEQSKGNYMNTAAPLAITPDGRRIAYYSEKDQKFAVRDLASGKIWLAMPTVTRQQLVTRDTLLHLSPDGRYLAINGAGGPMVDDVETRRFLPSPKAGRRWP